jgi:hypothetical protein
MVFEHFQNSSDIKDSLLSGFVQLYQLGSHVVASHILRFVAQVLGAIRFLALAKPLGGVQLIAMGEAFYWFVNRVLCL